MVAVILSQITGNWLPPSIADGYTEYFISMAIIRVYTSLYVSTSVPSPKRNKLGKNPDVIGKTRRRNSSFIC